ncbi:MAG: lipopolysaccharide biosynthesis protein [Sulfuricaulis sp.]
MQILAALATIKIATSLMSPGQVGSINQVTALSSLLYATFITPVSYYVMRGLLDWHDSGMLAERLRKFIRYVTIVSVLSALAIFLIEWKTNIVSSISGPWVTLLILLYLLAFSIHTVASTGLIILGRRAAYVIFTNAASWIGLGAAIFFLWQTAKPEMWLLGIYGGFVVSSCLYLGSSYFQLSHNSRIQGHVQDHVPFTLKKVLAFAWPMAIIYVLGWIQLQSYRFLLEGIAGLASVGLFFAAHAICAAPMQTFQTMFNEFYSQTLYRRLKGESREGLAKAWNAYAAVYVPAVILFGSFLMGCGPYLAKILLGPEFQIVASILIWPAMVETLRGISTSLDTMGIVKIDMKINVLPSIVGAICAPLLIYLLAKHNPLVGTGVALTLSGLASLIVVIPISYRALPIRWPIERIIFAMILGLPMVIVGNVASRAVGAITWPTALVGLGIGIVYLIIGQYFLARAWLGNMSSSG